MINFNEWKQQRLHEEFNFQIGNLPEKPEEPDQSNNFRNFIDIRLANKSKRMQSIKEFIGSLASIPKASERRAFLDSHLDIRDDLAKMSESDWNKLEEEFKNLNPVEYRRLGHALKWLHMHMKSFGPKYNRRNDNLTQWNNSFRVSKDL